MCVCRAEQLYQKVMSLWHQLHVNMKSVVSWHYLLKDIRNVSGWNLDTVSVCIVCVFAVLLLFHSVVLCLHLNIPVNDQVRCQSPAERQQVLTHLESHLADFLSDSKESTLFTPGDRQELEEDVQQAQQHCQDLLLNMEAGELTATNKPHAHPLRSRTSLTALKLSDLFLLYDYFLNQDLLNIINIIRLKTWHSVPVATENNSSFWCCCSGEG